jgi:peptidoglycan hydrolase-like protein with peptidoglycan-binding domain
MAMDHESMRRSGGGMAMDHDKVKAVQQALKDKGHDPGDVDGKMGPKTHAALREFQKAQGLQGSGRVDDKTMQALGVEGQKTGGSASPTTGSGASSSTGGSSATGGSSGTGGSTGGSSSPSATGSGTSTEKK